MQATGITEGQIVPVLHTFERITGTEALSVPEILRAILYYATPPTLASAARVSRAWSTIALDRLWSDNDVKITDLLKILPLMFRVYGYVPIPVWDLSREPDDSERARFLYYASRVRSLYLPNPASERFHRALTDWKAENDATFPRLRRVQWTFSQSFDIPSSELSSFITSGLRELKLRIVQKDMRAIKLATSALNNLAENKQLRLEKFKLDSPLVTPNFGSVLRNFVASQNESIQTLELLTSTQPLDGQSLSNLNALDIWIQPVQGEEGSSPIQALVEACPHVMYLRMRITLRGLDPLDFSSLHATLGWRLLSFEVWSPNGISVTKAQVSEMATAWPKLKRLNITQERSGSLVDGYLTGAYSKIPLSHLLNIGAGFPHLQELSSSFHYDLDEGQLLPLDHSSSPLHRLACLRKLRLGTSRLPKSQKERESMARFLASVCPPGLRIERTRVDTRFGILSFYVPWEETVDAMSGRDLDPEWDALFQTIEELQGGVKIWVGSIPEEKDGVWF